MNVLVVDDDPIILDLFQTLLIHHGFKTVCTVESAQGAMEAIRCRDAVFDCLVIDVNMPDTDGITLCRMLRAMRLYRNIPIIMIAAVQDLKILEEAFSAGASDFISKPLKMEEVIERMQLARAVRDPAQLRQLASMCAKPDRLRNPAESWIRQTHHGAGCKLDRGNSVLLSKAE